MMHIPENFHLWALFAAGHGLHVLKRAGLSVQSRISGTKTRVQWLQTNALNLSIRFFVNAAAFSYWMAHPNVATHVAGAIGVPMDSNARTRPRHCRAFRPFRRQHGGLGRRESAIPAERNPCDGFSAVGARHVVPGAASQALATCTFAIQLCIGCAGYDARSRIALVGA